MILVKSRHDEGSNGLLCVPRDGDEPSKREGGGKGDRATGTNGLEVVQVNKLDLTRQLLQEPEAQVEALKKILKDKEGEISKAKGHLRQVEEDAVLEYRDSNTLLKELGGFFADEFDDCFRQVKASFSDLDLSHISIDTQAQTLAQPVYPEGTDDLFANETNLDPHGDGDATPANQEKSVGDGTY